MALDKAGLLAAMELKKETVTLPGGEVIVSELSATDYLDVYESPLAKDEKGDHSGIRFAALMCVRCMVDEKGERIMADEDAEAFGKGSRAVFEKVNKAVTRINGLSGEEAKN